MWSGLVRVWAVGVVVAVVGVRAGQAACTMAEFPCRSKQCIGLDKYCDGRPDCHDNSDEPSGCSPCNRTYYGRVGATYRLHIPRPRRGTLPHFCQLTFIASGDTYGDLVQLSIDKFTLGRFVSHTAAGCPDGYMQIEELSRPLNSGYWCGTAWGHNVFYSETSAITVMLRVFNLTEDASSANPAAFTPQEDVMLAVSYRFLRKERAVLRYGAPYSPKYRGEDVPNTFCDKDFENCDKKNCKVQSPNFPGMYPRNLTCHYHVRQGRVPDGKVALIRVRQRNPHLIYIKDRNAPHLSRERKLQVGSACHVLYDYLVAYDGNNTREAVLATLCKGGAPLSGITSSGPHLLLVFHASPFDFPFQDSPRRRTFGFELDVEVEFVDRESTAYIREGAACNYTVSSRGQRSGYVQSPVHSLLANTTCWWRLLAGSTEVVWLYFLHYRHVQHPEMPTPPHCSNTLTITDGDALAHQDTDLDAGPAPAPAPALDDADNTTLNTSTTEEAPPAATVIGTFCRPDHLPRVCSGVHAPGPHAAPCLPGESYVSASPALTLSLRYAAGTAPAHVEFLARYEFVDKRQWGAPTPGGGPCDRTFTAQPDRLFASPRDVFLFGRGGARKLRCIYTFRAGPRQRVELRILRARMGSGCGTRYRHASHRYECSHAGAGDQPAIWLSEEPWEGVPLVRACLCNVSHERPFVLTSYTQQLRLTFSVPVMTPAADYNDFFLEGEYSLLPAEPECRQDARRLAGRHGNFTVGAAARRDLCATLPRLVTAADGSFLFLRVRGHAASEDNCGAAARINVYAVGGLAPLASICPDARLDYTHVFSSGWHGANDTTRQELTVAADLWSSVAGTVGSGGSLHLGQSHYYYYHRQQQVAAAERQQQRGRPSQQRARQQESRDLVVELVGNSSERVMVSWVGVWRPMQTAPLSPVGVDLCPHRCPQIEACLPADLWCDGSKHCPSGLDEGAAACGLLAALPWVYLGAGGVLAASLLALLAAVVVHRRRLQALKRQEEAVAAVANNSHGLKSTTQDFLLPPDKDSW